MYLIGTCRYGQCNCDSMSYEKELNATLSVEWIGWGDLQMNILFYYPREQVDLVYAANWLIFMKMKGAFLPLKICFRNMHLKAMPV